MPFDSEKSPFRQSLPDPKEIEKDKQEFEEIARRNMEKGLDRSNESVGRNTYHPHQIQEDAIRKQIKKEQENKRPRRSERKASGSMSKSRLGTSWVGMVGDKIDESERRMDDLM